MRTSLTLLAALVGLALTAAPAAADESPQGLTALEKRCQAMLEAQTCLHEEVADIGRQLAKSGDKKATPEQSRALAVLAKRQRALAEEVNGAVKDLEEDGSATAFAEVLRGVRDDMKGVQRHLEAGDVGAAQSGSADMVEMLKEMVEALTRH